jgi:CheY-like chemotaxis protein
LGLAISRQLVRLMGSDIQVQSVFGQGSTFWFDLTIPVVPEAARPSQSRQRAIIGYRGRPRQVLIVDNEPTNRRVLRDLLQPLGFACMEAENGREALDTARRQLPDLILLDLFMPVMNGFETLQHLRQDPLLADVVVIAVSASAFEAEQAHSLSAGCQAFLPKPVEARHLLRILETYLNIEWQYQESDERSTTDALPVFVSEFPCLPPQEELQHVYQLTLTGDLFGLQQYAIALQQRDVNVQAFVAELVRLAKAYQDEQLLTFIERYMEQKA